MSGRALRFWLGTAALATALVFALLRGLPGREVTLSRGGLSMDTPVRISVTGRDEGLLTEALDGAFTLLGRMNDELSLYNAASALSRVNARSGEPGFVPVSPDVRAVIEEARRANALTGAFNPLIGPITRLWRINSPAGSDVSTLPPQASLDAALALTAPGVLELGPGGVRLARRGAALDLGGIAKGCASSRIAELLSSRGVASALIDLGGNIHVVGRNHGRPWNIGVRDPLSPRGAPIAVLSVSDTAVITSGGYERYRIVDGVRYSHFFDPRTGMPVRNNLLSATLVTPDGGLADALATAFMVLGSEGAMQFLRDHETLGLGAVLIRARDGGSEILATANLRGRIRSPASTSLDVTFF